MRLLLAEDERSVRLGLVRLLEGAGYEVTAVRDGARALEAFRTQRPEGVLLDVMMPRKDGREVCREIRTLDPAVPILFLTACDSESDELAGLALGADAYLSKTLSDDLLLARLAAALRPREDRSSTFTFGPATIDPNRLTLSLPDSPFTFLSERDVLLLRWFLAHPGEIATRDFLLTRFWQGEDDPTDNALTSALSRLRRKLGPAADSLVMIRGIGYAYRP